MVVLASCSDFLGDEKANVVIAAFHDALANGTCEAFHPTTSAAFQKTMDLERFVAFCEKHVSTFGTPKDFQNMGWKSHTSIGSGKTLALQVVSTYSDTMMNETFTFTYDGEQPVLMGYNYSASLAPVPGQDKDQDVQDV